MGKQLIPKRISKITIPEKANPLAKLAFAEMQRQGKTYADIEWEAGVLITTIKAWRQDNRPGLDTIEAVLGALGYQLVAVPKLERLDDDLRTALEAVADKFPSDDVALGLALAYAGRRLPPLGTKEHPAPNPEAIAVTRFHLAREQRLEARTLEMAKAA